MGRLIPTQPNPTQPIGKDRIMSFNNSRAMRFASELIANINDNNKMIALARNAAKGTKRKWGKAFRQLARELTAGEFKHTILAKGNSKLPFFTFSTLPIVTCPGHGACGEWCYSFSAWRYPDAFMRQLKNTILMMKYPEKIKQAFNRLPKGVTLRLYVDGDFSSCDDVDFWFQLLKSRPDISAYGYSKSWDEIYNWGIFNEYPNNYRLNLSSGGRQRKITENMMEKLPITRGRFVAVKIDLKLIKLGIKRYALPEYHQAVRDAARAEYGQSAFSCAGLCGQCLPNGVHACGMDKAKGMLIANGIH